MRRAIAIPLLAGVLVLAPAAVSGATVAVYAEGDSPAGQTVSGCFQRSGHLLVDVEIDRSGSLKGTDPEDRRVDGVGAALLGLANLAEAVGEEGESPRIEVLLSSFAGTVEPRRPGQHWQVLDGDSIDRLLRAAESYGERDSSRDTDYALALGAANRALNERARTVYDGEGAPPCKALIFFSDGKFHLGDRTDSTSLPAEVPYAPGVDLGLPGGGEKAVEAGQRYLCRPGGLRDRMVDAGIVMFTVALSASREFTPEDRATLEALTTGARGGCGRELSSRTGQFVEVRDSGDLFFGISGVVPGTGPDTGPGICPKPHECPNPSQFATFPGLAGFTLSASAPRRGVELQLVDPRQERLILSSGDQRVQNLGDVEVRQHWIQSRAMEVRAFFEPGSESWVGTWRFRFFAPEASTPVPTYDLNLQSDLRPRVVGESKLAEDAKSTIHLRLVDSTGAPVASGRLVDAARLDAEVRDGAGNSHPVTVKRGEPGNFTVAFQVPRETPAGVWTLSGALDYSGTDIPVESGLFDLELSEPDGGEMLPIWMLILIGAGIVLALTLAAFAFSYWRRLADARFTPPQILRVFGNEAVVTKEGELELVPPLGPHGLRYDDFRHLKRSGRDTKTRRLSLKQFELTAKVPWRLRGRPRGVAVAGGRKLLGGNKERAFQSRDGGVSVEVPLDLAGTWLFAIGPADELGRVSGELAIFTDDDSEHDLGREVLEAARAALREQDWQELAPPSREKDPDIDWDNLEPEADLEDVDWESI